MTTTGTMDGAVYVAPPKAIRFVNNAGQPPQKRRRINAACLTCRKRKTRCAGEHPACSTCTKNGHHCLGYSEAPEKKRHSVSTPATDELLEHDYDSQEGDDCAKKRLSRSKNEIEDLEGMEDVSPHGLTESSSQSVSSGRPNTENIRGELYQNGSNRTEERPRNFRQASYSTNEDMYSPSVPSPILQHRTEGHRVPYFRYFGPTAIVPGFKQMVVKVRNKRRGSLSATSPCSTISYAGLKSVTSDHASDHPDDMPVYDPNDPDSVSPVILSLVDTFFVHFGCIYPFLHRNKFLKLVQDKRVEPILVDAVCALAARFSDLPMFDKYSGSGKLSKADSGNIFAQRAKAATVDTFPCPTVAAVQACLLMAYEGFGADQDSALWMYLGLAIRMAVDLGLHKRDGIKFQGEKDPWYTRSREQKAGDQDAVVLKPEDDNETLTPQEQKEVEQERIDTLWSVYFLDRVISSGTGRPVTLRDDDFDLELPKTSVLPGCGLPDPFPPLIQIIRLYGKVSDVLNKVISPKDLTHEKLKRLKLMENELTRLHQRQNSRLRFDANNFKKYADNGHGATFILLHFWFHALIIVLHQPTLLAPQQVDEPQQLSANSREVSMSSAKTIADILAFASFIEPRSFLGTPFTSQPIYIAACAFLKESVTNPSLPFSEHNTPPPEAPVGSSYSGNARRGLTAHSKSPSRHFLLASAANQNYQACYKALEQMHTYWGGIRYILTALHQRSEGTWDCETYTREEYESTKPPRRKGSIGSFSMKSDQHPLSPMAAPLAWSLTGTTNSPNPTLTLVFQGNATVPSSSVPSTHPSHQPASAPTPPGNMIYDPIRQSLPEPGHMYPPAYPQPNTSALRHSVNQTATQSVSNASLQSKALLRYDALPSHDVSKTPPSPGSRMQMPASSQASTAAIPPASFTPSSQHSLQFEPTSYITETSPTSTFADINSHTGTGLGSGATPSAAAYPPDGGSANFAQSTNGLAGSGYSYGAPAAQDMRLVTIDNETDIGHHLASFEPMDMINWFGDYFPNDVLGLYDPVGSTFT